MNLQKVIQSEIAASMKARDTDKLSVLRMVKAAFTNYMIEKRKESLTEEEVNGILQKQIKQRQESYENFIKGSRNDLATKEKKEIDILVQYLPKPLEERDLMAIVDKAIEESQATGKHDMGKVMKLVMAKVQGRSDGKAVSAMVVRGLERKT